MPDRPPSLRLDDLPQRLRTVWRDAPAPSRWGAVSALVMALVLGGLLLAFDWNGYRGAVAAYASGRLHRPVVIAGDLKVHPWSLSPSAEAGDVRISEPDWARAQSLKQGAGGDMVRIGRLSVQIHLLPLLRGQVILPVLAFDHLDLRLRRQADGQANWRFGPPSKAGVKLPAIQRLIIHDGTLTINDDQRHVRFEGKVSSDEQEGGAGRGVFHLDGDGRLNGELFKARVTGAPLLNVSPDRPYRFQADVVSGPSHIAADGAITHPFDLGRFDTRLSASGPNLNRLYELTGVAFPNTPPYRLSGRLVRAHTRWTVSGLSGRVGDSDLSGDLAVEAGGKRKLLTGDLTSRHLLWDNLLTVFGGPPKIAKGRTYSPEEAAMAAQLAAEHRVLPDARLQVGRIRAMDADVRFRALSISDPHLPVRALDVTVTLKDGVLTANPLRLTLASGHVSGSLRLDARQDMPVTNADLTLSDGRLEGLVPLKSGGKPALEGAVQARINVTGSGDSVRRAAAAADGRASVVISGGQMRQAFAELLGVNASKGLLLLLSKDQGETPIRCAVADFTVKNGVMRADQVVFDTGVVLAQGSGTVDLGQERLDLSLKGQSKKPRLLHLMVPITIKGPWVGPKIGVDTSKLLGQGGAGAALGALVNPLAAVIPFLSLGGAKDADCAALTAQARGYAGK